jgi:predicted phage tail protein
MTYKINLFSNLLKTLRNLVLISVDLDPKRTYTIRTIRATEEQPTTQAVQAATGRERFGNIDTGVQYTPAARRF